MPYIGVDVDALDEFERVAIAAPIAPGDVYRGLLRLWLYCWKKKRTHVSREVLAGFFPGDLDRIIPALIACEFLDAEASGELHVRGAEKRLGLMDVRSEAGAKGGRKSASSGKSLKNLRQYSRSEAPTEAAPKLTEAQPPNTEANASEPPKQMLRTPEANTEALTSNIQHPASKHPTPIASSGPRKHVTPVVRVEKPAAPRETWKFPEWQQWAQFKRQEAGLVPEDPVPIYEGERFWAVVTDWTGGAVQPVCAAFIAFGDDPYWQGQSPPLPLRAFMAQWAKYMPPKEKPTHAVRRRL